VDAHVGGEAAVHGELLAALDADVRLDLVVHGSHVVAEAVGPREGLVAEVALAVKLLGVHRLHVDSETALLREALAAQLALVRFDLRVHDYVVLEAALAVAGIVAQGTSELLLLRPVDMFALHVLVERVDVGEELHAELAREEAA